MKPQNINCDIAIIGAGLTGLTLAYLLRNSGKSIKIIEARGRLGGRILTKGYLKNQPIEMGATWLGNQHQHLISFLNELNISTFNQKIGDTAIYEAISTSPHYLAQLPPNPNPSMRIKGGTEKLIHTLAENLDSGDIILNQPITSITQSKNDLSLQSKDYIIQAQTIVSTLPPNLIASTISFSPQLPNEFIQICKSTHTWMGESIKIALSYSEPFWKNKNLSGTIMSNVGPIGEMYDHSNYEENFFALKGFFNGNYFSSSPSERLAMIMNQLEKYFGDIAKSYLNYEESVWTTEKYTSTPYQSHVLPHQNNGHQLYQEEYMNGKFIFGGTETSLLYPGYMEGAIFSAKSIAKKLV